MFRSRIEADVDWQLSQLHLLSWQSGSVPVSFQDDTDKILADPTPHIFFSQTPGLAESIQLLLNQSFRLLDICQQLAKGQEKGHLTIRIINLTPP